MTASDKTLLYAAYRVATNIALPFAFNGVRRKLKAHDVPVARIEERKGHATQPRPKGPLLWFHAASVGESLSVLALITRMGEMRPELSFLVTSGTATSAALVARRLPPRTLHQYAPLDAAKPLDRFLKHWQPDAALFVESELWPQMIVRSFDAGIPLALVNARLSNTSLTNWGKRPKTFRMILSRFEILLTQTKAMGVALIKAGADPQKVQGGTDLKSTSVPLPVDPKLSAQLHKTFGNRPVWVAASTHDGEEEIVLQAHKTLLNYFPDLCLILAPRHPERGGAVQQFTQDAGLTHRRRSDGQDAGDAQVYLADTMGELGNWYDIGKFVFLGGSLSDIGGHNPYEVAQAGLPVITGPFVRNFDETYDSLTKLGGSVTAASAHEIAAQAAKWLQDVQALKTASQAAEQFVLADTETLDTVATQLLKALKISA